MVYIHPSGVVHAALFCSRNFGFDSDVGVAKGISWQLEVIVMNITLSDLITIQSLV